MSGLGRAACGERGERCTRGRFRDPTEFVDGVSLNGGFLFSSEGFEVGAGAFVSLSGVVKMLVNFVRMAVREEGGFDAGVEDDEDAIATAWSGEEWEEVGNGGGLRGVVEEGTALAMTSARARRSEER